MTVLQVGIIEQLKAVFSMLLQPLKHFAIKCCLTTNIKQT